MMVMVIVMVQLGSLCIDVPRLSMLSLLDSRSLSCDSAFLLDIFGVGTGYP